MLKSGATYEEVYGAFKWDMPETFNIGVSCCDVHAERDPDQPALIEWAHDASPKHHSFADLKSASNKLANALTDLGLTAGDRLGIILPQSLETAICHMAAYKMGAIAVPLARLFASEAIRFRLERAGVSIVVTNRDGLEKIESVRSELPDLKHVICTDSDGVCAVTHDFHDLLGHHEENYSPVSTTPDTPALIIFTSGTTGPPKGALHGHRVLLGHIPGIQFHHDFFPKPGDICWTPADWAWAGGLLNMLLPSLYFGVPVVFGGLDRFDPEKAFQLLEETKTRNAFIPPTALKLMKSVPDAAHRYDLKLRSIGSAGESLGADTYAWAKDHLKLTINEFYGQTECNLILSSAANLGVSKSNSTGKPVPGHTVSIVDEQGNELSRGQQGQIAVKAPDPVMFLGYWEDEVATREKYLGDWMITGDQAIIDDEGYFQFIGRDDDIINSAGYRVGPGEIEDCLLSHEAVKLAVAVGKPDALRSEIVKAYVVLSDGVAKTNTLAEEIRLHVKGRLAANIYPREIAFVDSIPMTTTGKVIRQIFRQRAREEYGEENDLPTK